MGLTRLSIIITAIASLIFYGAHDVQFVPLMLCSVIVNFCIGNRILSSQDRATAKIILISGIGFNLGLLFFFKYTVFTVLAINGLMEKGWSVPSIVLPIGISFYTFTQIAYITDCWRGRAHRCRFTDYLLFVTFFPHLIAGPILKHAPFLAQLHSGNIGRPSLRRAYIGVCYFCIGLFKKVLIADSISPIVRVIFDNAFQLSFIDAWFGAILYTLQLYYDFSGYSEMAIGLALLLNLRIPLNFNSPYKAKSIIDFWRRWHMSLSYFLREYLYFSLGGSRVGGYRHYYNLFVVMLLGGIWHGAGYTFILWGVLHGFYLVINHIWRRYGFNLHVWSAQCITFIAVICAWVIFRAKKPGDAFSMLASMFGLNPVNAQAINYTMSPTILTAVTIVMLGWVFIMPNTQQVVTQRNPSLKLAFILSWTTLFCLLSLSKPSEFLYFQF